MKKATIEERDYIVVGQFFAVDRAFESEDGKVGCQLMSTYMGTEAHSWLQESFDDVPNENWEELARSNDPVVRLLVARNLECLDQLRHDVDPNVSSIAEFAASHMYEPFGGVAPHRV